MEITQSLKTVLKRIRLSGMLPTLPDRVAYAKKTKMPYPDFLELVLQDEIDRRDQVSLMNRLQKAQFEDEQIFENFDWDVKVTFDRDLVRDLFSLGFLDRNEDVIFMGHAGVGKTFLASALGHSACRAGKQVQFIRADTMLKQLQKSRADNSTEKLMRKLISCDLLILDDFGLSKLDQEKSCDLYELIIERHRKSSTIITSNRTTDEWIPLFSDPLLAQSALDRLAHNAHQIEMEGETYRPNLGPAASKNTKNRRKK
ncbi:MAG: IS21-like element helper ATPase IstB [Deltaproteobacteria bacterium]|nr:IS21-like element helper ATPase IstB [Deltaproteobacteria bacterium]